MKTFREFVEGLKIVKKKEDNQVRPERTRETKQKPKIDVSYFDTVRIVRSKHSQEIRANELKPRDEGLRDATILKAVKKAWKKGLKENEKTLITYKNKSKKYDMIIVEWIRKQNKIILVTAIQGNKDKPNQYFRASNKDQQKIMTENIEFVATIELEFILD